MAQTPTSPSRLSRLGPAGTLLSLLACYGTLAVVGALSLMGITLAVNVQVWAGAIVVFALIAVFGVAVGYRRHRTVGPVIIAAIGAMFVTLAMYGSEQIQAVLGFPSLIIEVTGFVALAAAAIWDWRLTKVAQMAE